VRRALDELGRSNDSAKKAGFVPLTSQGRGKGEVRVGMRSRLRVEDQATGWCSTRRGAKPYLAGWAIVENPTDDDWFGGSMALVKRRSDQLQETWTTAVRPRAGRRAGAVRSLGPPHLRRGVRPVNVSSHSSSWTIRSRAAQLPDDGEGRTGTDSLVVGRSVRG